MLGFDKDNPASLPEVFGHIMEAWGRNQHVLGWILPRRSPHALLEDMAHVAGLSLLVKFAQQHLSELQATCC